MGGGVNTRRHTSVHVFCFFSCFLWSVKGLKYKERGWGNATIRSKKCGKSTSFNYENHMN